MFKYFVKSVFLALLALPLIALAEEERDLSFIDGIWQSYDRPTDLLYLLYSLDNHKPARDSIGYILPD